MLTYYQIVKIVDLNAVGREMSYMDTCRTWQCLELADVDVRNDVQ